MPGCGVAAWDRWHALCYSLRMKLLIVDDSNILRRAIEKYLSTFGMTIVGTAGDGESGSTAGLRWP